MKPELTLEAVLTPGQMILPQVIAVLATRPEPLENFVWSVVPDSGEARIWIMLGEDEAELPELVGELGRVAGVRRVMLHGPGQSIKEALVGLVPKPNELRREPAPSPPVAN